jgi:hypothetical protein
MAFNSTAEISLQCCTYEFPLTKQYRILQHNSDFSLRHRVQNVSEAHPASYTSTYIPYLDKECVQVNLHPPVRLHCGVPNEAEGQLHMHNNTNFER